MLQIIDHIRRVTAFLLLAVFIGIQSGKILHTHQEKLSLAEGKFNLQEDQNCKICDFVLFPDTDIAVPADAAPANEVSPFQTPAFIFNYRYPAISTLNDRGPPVRC